MSNRIALDQLPKRYQDQVAQEMARNPSRRGAKLQPIPTPPPGQKNALEAKGSTKAGILLTLPYPPSANRYWRSIVIKGHVRVLLSTEAREFKRIVTELARYTKPRLPGPLTGPLRLTLSMYRPQKSGDLSNRIKVVEDALNGIAYEDDNQIVEIVARRHDDKADPRVTVLVEQL